MIVKKGLNPNFLYENKGVTLLSDDKIDGHLVQSITDHVNNYGLTLDDFCLVDVQGLKALSHRLKQEDDSRFKKVWESLAPPIDRKKLMNYAIIENPKLYERLKKGDEIKDALLSNVRVINSEENNIHVMAIGRMMQFLKQSYNSHFLLVLQKHNVVAPISTTRSGELAYHFVGRGCIYYGGSNSISGRSMLDNHYVFVSLQVMDDQPKWIKNNFVKEIFDHEFMGHSFLGLDDHFDLEPDKCVMATKKSRAEYIETSKNYKGLYFCHECKKKVAYDPQFFISDN